MLRFHFPCFYCCHCIYHWPCYYQVNVMINAIVIALDIAIVIIIAIEQIIIIIVIAMPSPFSSLLLLSSSRIIQPIICNCWILLAGKFDEWQERVPKLISGDVQLLTQILEDHYTRENRLASLNSRSVLEFVCFLAYSRKQWMGIVRVKCRRKWIVDRNLWTENVDLRRKWKFPHHPSMA